MLRTAPSGFGPTQESTRKARGLPAPMGDCRVTLGASPPPLAVLEPARGPLGALVGPSWPPARPPGIMYLPEAPGCIIDGGLLAPFRATLGSCLRLLLGWGEPRARRRLQGSPERAPRRCTYYILYYTTRNLLLCVGPLRALLEPSWRSSLGPELFLMHIPTSSQGLRKRNWYASD